MMTEKIIEKMIVLYNGNLKDINHFIKVFTFASLIGKLESVDESTQRILEIAAIVHDISCPLCRQKYGNTNGKLQEEESEPLLRDFLEEFELPKHVEERIIFLVGHHHTYSNVEGLDYQILLEADFLVNAGESSKYSLAVDSFREKVFKTPSGRRLLDEMYGTSSGRNR